MLGLGLALLAVASAQNSYRHFDIDLNLPPRRRWQHVYHEFREAIVAEVEYNDMALDHYDRWQLDELVKHAKIKAEYMEELKGIVEVLNFRGVTLRNMILRQLGYEMGMTRGHGCTGILMALPNGTVLHGRNLDLPGDREHILSQVIDVTFKRRGSPPIRSLVHLGTIGVHNGYRSGAWSFEQNTRYETMTDRYQLMGRNIEEAKKGAAVLMLEARTVLEEEKTYADARRRLRTTRFMAPHYFILAGSGAYEGAVMTVPAAEDYPLYNMRLLSSTQWYLVQTNDDWEGPAMDTRRQIANTFMSYHRPYDSSSGSSNSSSSSKSAMELAMRVWPVCNVNTVFTWYMSAATGMDYVVDDKCGKQNRRLRQPTGDESLMPRLGAEGLLPEVTPLLSSGTAWLF